MAKNDRIEDGRVTRKLILQKGGQKRFPEPFLAPYGVPREELGLREFWRGLKRHKLVLLVTILLITTVADFFILRAKSTYLATTTLLISEDSPAILRAAERFLKSEDSDAATEIAIKTKMVIMKSQELLEDVIVNLKLDQNPKFNDGRTSVGTPEKEGLRSAKERARLAPLVNRIEKNLSIEQIKETRALKISFVHTDPEIAAAVADGIAQQFIQRSFQNKIESFTGATSWLNQSTAELKERAENAEKALADYTRAHNIFTTDGASTLITDKLSKLHEQVTRAETDRIMKETLYEEMKLGRVSEVPEVFAAMISESSPRIVELQRQLDDLTADEAQLSVRYGPSNPQLQEVRQKIAAVKEQIGANRNALNARLRTEYEHAVRQEQSLKAALDDAKVEAVDENQATIQYDILKQEVETAKTLYHQFLEISNRSKMQVAEQYNSARIIDHARVPTVAYGPRRALNMLLWLIVSLMAGVGLAMLIEFLDNTIKNENDVAQFLRLSTLTVIPPLRAVTYQLPPKFPGRSGPKGRHAAPATTAEEKERSFLPGDITPVEKDGLVAAESYHALRTSMLLSIAEEPPKTILVTSSQVGEGKTTTVINLAFSLCELDARVLVIDADMRRPTAHDVFDLDREQGLSTYLSKEVAISDLLQHLSKPKLSFLASGPTPPNPASLLSSPKMKLLLDILSYDYDYIVIDSPPIAGVSDTRILSTIVDGVVLVVQGSKSRREAVRRVKNDLASVGARIIGVVLNNIKLKSDGPNNYADTRYYFKQTD